MGTRTIEEKTAECLERMRRGHLTAAQAASYYPEDYDELLGILETYQIVSHAEKPAVRPEFRKNARIRLQNQMAASQPVVTKQNKARPIWRTTNPNPYRRFSMTWLILIGLAATILAGGGGVAYASTDALPGDALYSVKNTLHDVELAFQDDAGDADLLLNYVKQNLAEMQELANQGRYDDIAAGLDAYQENLEALTQTQTRISYDNPAAGDSLNTRIQQQLQTCTDSLLQLQDQIRDRTQDQLHLQDKLQQAIQLTETGKTYGPNLESGQPTETGQPNGAGPGEPQSSEAPTQGGQPDGAGNDNGNGAGSGEPQSSETPSQNGQPDDAGTGSDNGNSAGGQGGSGQGMCTCADGTANCLASDADLQNSGMGGGNMTCTCVDGVIECVGGQGSGNGQGGNGQGGKP